MASAYPGSNNNKDVQRLVSRESAHLTDYDSDELSDYDSYYDNNDGDDEGTAALHSLLLDDMERLKAIYGQDALSYRLFSLVDSIDVELQAQTSFLEREVSVAWKINPTEPLIIRVHLSASHYLDGGVPKVEVFQPSQKERFGIGSQMRKILENFLFNEWRTLNNDVLTGHLKTKTPPQQSSPSKQQAAAPRPVDPVALSKILEMGFSAEMGQNALVMSRGSLEEAVTLLLTNPDVCYPKEPKSPHTSPTHSLGAGRPRAPGAVAGVGGSSLPARAAGQLWARLTGNKATIRSEKDAKDNPGLDQGFLVMLLRYVYQRLPTLNEFCVVCDELHIFQNGGMLKPSVCARELCVFAFMSLGVMADAANEIATGADVVDLLIAMANAGCRAQKKEDIFEPFPTVIDPLRPKVLALSPKKKDFPRCAEAISSFMRMSEMSNLSGQDLKKELDLRDNLSYPLLQWIITSNRSHIVKLPLEKQLACMRTPHQFLLMSSPPAKEAAFKQAKAKHGSAYAFHGSPLENWHSILRQGLMNASGTKYQRHGAAHGKGVYLSPLSSVSYNYSGMVGQSTAAKIFKPRLGANKSSAAKPRRFLQSTNLTCVALCEVVTSEQLRKSGQIWVMPEADHVCTRFFFVYEDGQVGDTNINTQDPQYYQEIENAVRYHVS